MEHVSLVQLHQTHDSSPLPNLYRPDTLSLEQRFHVLMRLQESLLLEQLLASFAAQAARFVPFCTLKFQSLWGHVDVGQPLDESVYEHRERIADPQGITLGLVRYYSRLPFTDTDLSLLQQLQQLLSTPLRNACQLAEVRQSSLRDHLTGIGNRAAFDEQLLRSLEQARRQHNEMVLMLFDMNDFKHINDNHGHLAGDEVLAAFATALRASIRSTDSAYRLGGDEFALILTPADVQSAPTVLMRVQQELQQDPTLVRYHARTSCGWASSRDSFDAQQLFQLADKQMYRQKPVNNGAAGAR